MSELFAILAALCSAFSSILLGELKGRVSLLQLVRWQMAAAFLMTALAGTVLGGWQTLGWQQFGLLSLSGLAGIVVAGTAYIATIHAVGPRITALLFSLTSPFTLILGYVFLGETISGRQLAGVAFVLAGIMLAIGLPRRFSRAGRRKPPMPAPAPTAVPLSPVAGAPMSGPLLPGIALGILTAIGQSIGALLARPAMSAGVEPFTAMAVRSGTGALIFAVLTLAGVGRGARAHMDARSWALVLGAASIGTSIGMAFLMAALALGNTGVVSTLSSLTPVLILPMLWIIGREKPSASASLGAALAIAGVALISA